MKQLLATLLTVTLIGTFAACGAASEPTNSQGGTAVSASQTEPSAAQPEESPAEAASETSSETEPPAETAEEPPAESPAQPADETADPEGSKILIAYFSWSGNTETLAGMIQQETGGDLFAIETQTPYTDDYDTLVDQAKQEQEDNARPALAAQVEHMEDYDTVFLGYPNWWNDVPMAVLTFVESYDWTGKTIIPFCTSGGGGFGNGVNSIESAAQGASFLEGFHVGGSRVDDAAGDVAAWLSSLELEQ